MDFLSLLATKKANDISIYKIISAVSWLGSLRIALSYIYTGLVLLPIWRFGGHTHPPGNHLQNAQL